MLAALEEKFGKKPNIIYILSDDIGWGELGWQGGGKHRGTPTSELDKMAYEGMRFYAAYSEPSCTPSRVAINTGSQTRTYGFDFRAMAWCESQRLLNESKFYKSLLDSDSFLLACHGIVN